MEKAAMCVLINLLVCILVFNISLTMDVLRVGISNVNGARDQKKRTLIYKSS